MQHGRGQVLASFLGVGLGIVILGHPVNAQELPLDDTGATASIGPDVIVADMDFSPVVSWGYQNTATGYITGFSVGTQSCNIGTAPVLWQQLPSVNHPAIRSAMYRLKDNRFEQIGISWVKHGFFATNETLCDSLCSAPGNDGTALYPGCGDPYDSNLNGTRSYLGPSSDINAFTGGMPSQIVHPTTSGQNGRLQVHNTDLDPTLNANARYYVGSHYVTADDAAAGNALNNASYQRGTIVAAPTFPNDSCSGTDPNRFCFSYADFIHDQESPIHAWKAFDPSVVETEAPVPGEGLFTLAAKATDLGTGFWRYEYALQNLNSDRSGKGFTVPIAVGSAVTNAGFHDVEYHSGEPFSNTDWSISVLSGKIIWSGQDFAVNPNANALRWGTLYNFRFDSNAPPGNTTVVLDLFKPGAPNKINISTIGPIVGFIDCNENGIADGCDVDCEGIGCTQVCGNSDDCNHNGVPDECENDCNENGIADTCDLVPQGESLDCNHNTVPDECEQDCNHNGIPDNCETVLDTDEDGVNDCDDLCPTSTPPNGCAAPSFVCCYSNGFELQNYPFFTCLADHGTPLCHEHFPGSCQGPPLPCPLTTCRQGCMVGDSDGDGDFDLHDISAMADCYSGELGSPAFVEPSSQCRRYFDYDENVAVDSEDFELFRRLLTGPGGLP